VTANGVVVLPETAVPDDPRLVARALAGPRLTRTVRALSHRHQPRRPEADSLVREMRRAWREDRVHR
jgi:DNA-binding transcriptional LysR family regulator